MSGLTEDKLGCMVLYALTVLQFVIRETRMDRITKTMGKTASLLAASVERTERISLRLRNWQKRMRYRYWTVHVLYHTTPRPVFMGLRWQISTALRASLEHIPNEFTCRFSFSVCDKTTFFVFELSKKLKQYPVQSSQEWAWSSNCSLSTQAC